MADDDKPVKKASKKTSTKKSAVKKASTNGAEATSTEKVAEPVVEKPKPAPKKEEGFKPCLVRYTGGSSNTQKFGPYRFTAKAPFAVVDDEAICKSILANDAFREATPSEAESFYS